MGFKKNILANYISQIYVTIIGIVMVPVYLKYMGAEAYGLVGFFSMLQAWFQLLDMGLTPTMARETARFNGGASDALSLRRLLRALEGIFIAIAVLGGGAMVAGAGTIAGSWLKVQQLPLVEVQHAIVLMAVIIALRWTCGLYRGAINGFECLVWLSGFNIAVVTARFVLVIPFFIYVSTTLTDFFYYQVGIALVEVAVLITKTYQLLPKVESRNRIPWQWGPLRGVLKFSLSIAFTSSVWVVVTQTDKLVLSKLLSLTDYGYFTLAVLVAGGVRILSGPIGGALLPRLTKLNAQGDNAGLILLYRNATQFVAVIAIPASLVLAFFAEHVLWAWTGDADVARKAAPVLMLYALGNGILALGAFPYSLQFAKGDLKLHLIGNVFFVVVLIPCLVWATMLYGATGAGYAWVGANSLYFFTWVPMVHARFAKGLHSQWFLQDVGAIVLWAVAGVALAHEFAKWSQDRLIVAITLAVVSLTVLAFASVGSTLVRRTIVSRWRARFVEQG